MLEVCPYVSLATYKFTKFRADNSQESEVKCAPVVHNLRENLKSRMKRDQISAAKTIHHDPKNDEQNLAELTSDANEYFSYLTSKMHTT